MKFPAILVEIPHQMPPRAYVVESLSQLGQFAADSDANYDVAAPDDGGRALDAICQDLHALVVVDSPEDLAATLADGLPAHGWPESLSELQRAAMEVGWLSCEACGERPGELLSRPLFRTEPRRYLCRACEAREADGDE